MPKSVHSRAALDILVCEADYRNSFGVTFQTGTVRGLSLQVFADADNASTAADRRSGGLVMCAGTCVSRFSRTQKGVTPIATEAEHAALC